MALRHCTVTKLDDTFWRVDWEGEPVCPKPRGAPHFSPHAIHVSSRGAAWRAYGFGASASHDFGAEVSVDALLAMVGLTRHAPKPETAEERLRGFAEAAEEGCSIVGSADLRAALAELDRLLSEKREPDTITPRDLFAAAWLQNETHWQNHREDIAKRAFEMADAMMKERAR